MPRWTSGPDEGIRVRHRMGGNGRLSNSFDGILKPAIFSFCSAWLKEDFLLFGFDREMKQPALCGFVWVIGLGLFAQGGLSLVK